MATQGAADTLVPGTMLGRYEIRRLLGRGGMGAVYEAVHSDLKKRVAVKVLFGSLAANDEAKQRFLREGEAASRIRHPHVVDVTDVGTDGNLTYLVMEFLEGEDLASRVHRGPLPVQEAADILLPVFAGVGAAHDEGVIHRDLKPENIFLARPRHGGIQPKVLDFGVSKVIGDAKVMALTGTAATFGTPFYMPPEQLRGARQADQKSDQYALGVVLYECVTGRRPFEADNVYAMLRAIGDNDYPSPRSVSPLLSEGLESIIMRAMRLDPAERFPSLRHFGAALMAFASDNVRMVWADHFRVRDDVSGPVRAGMTQALPPSAIPTMPAGPGGSVSGTRIMQGAGPAPSRRPSGTTLGAATGQRLELLREKPRSRRGLVIGGVLVAGAGGALAFVFLRPLPLGLGEHQAAVSQPAQPPPVSTFRVDVTTEPTSATIELDGTRVGEGVLMRELPKNGREHRLVAHARGYREAVMRFTDEAPPPHLALEPEPVEAQAAPTEVAVPARGPGARLHPHHRRGAGAAGAGAAGGAPPDSHGPGTPSGPVPANGAPVLD
jgi:Protein kinase domain